VVGAGIALKLVYVVTRSDEIGGAQIHVRDLAQAMMEQGHRVIVVAGGNGLLFTQLRDRGVSCRSIAALGRAIRPWADMRAFFGLVWLLRRERPDLVSLHSSKAGLLGRVAACSTGVPALFTAHGWAFTEGVAPLMRRFYALVERLAARWAARIVTVSQYDRELALQCRVGHAEQLVLVHNGMPEVGGEALADPGTPDVHFVMTARFSAPKDHATLLGALARLEEGNWSLELIGTGSQQTRVAELAAAHGLAERVHFAGEIDDVAERLARAQVFVLTSWWEGLPCSIIEAMRAGLPVIASDVGGVNELVRSGENGWLVEPGDVESLTTCLQRLIGDPELRRQMGRASRRLYEQGFRFETELASTLQVYQSVIAGRERVWHE
jgi:glycosyltransferase involved in cell wall biosynthesis